MTMKRLQLVIDERLSSWPAIEGLMGRREEYRHELAPLLDQFYGTKKTDPLINYLMKKSNLPGPRANLELADVFVD